MVLTVLRLLRVVGRCVVTVVSAEVTLQTHVVGHQFGEDRREVHTDTHVLYDVADILAEHYQVIDIEVVTVHAVVYRLCLHRLVNIRTTEVVLRCLIAAVDEVSALLVGVDTDTVVLCILTLHGAQLLNLQHGVRQQCLVPVNGVQPFRLKAECLLRLFHDESSQVGGTRHVAGHDVILYESLQRVHAVLQVFKLMSFSIDIVREDGVINLTSEVVHGTKGTVGSRDAVLFEFQIVDRVRLYECGKAIFLGIGYPRHLISHVRLVAVQGIVTLVIGRVVNQKNLLTDSRKHECLIEIADFRVLTQDISNIAVRLLNHHVNRLHDTVLHRVVLMNDVGDGYAVSFIDRIGEDDMGSTFQVDHGIAVVVQTLRGSDVSSQQVGIRQTVLRHFKSRIHIGHQVRACNGVTICIRQLVKTRKSVILKKLLHSLVGRQEASIFSISGKQVHELCPLDNGLEITVFSTVIQVVAQHFTRERVVVLGIGLIRATYQRPSGHQGGQGHQCYLYILLDIHNIHCSSYVVISFSHSWYSRHCHRQDWVSGYG